MDRDEESIGDLERPPLPTRQLFLITVIMDIAGFAFSFLVSTLFARMYLMYIIFSRLYSYRGIRLKQYPLIGYLTVVLNQGALIFYMVYSGAGIDTIGIPWLPMLVSTLLIGAFYPITQIYQHEQDRKDGVTTISYLLGVNGTFIYCAVLYTISFALLAWYFNSIKLMEYFFILLLWFIPVIARFLWWQLQCLKDAKLANYRNTMFMNRLAAICTNLAFITLILLRTRG
jgi:1,4-dihydroxy-2-naphthoate octaprenyltransferase